MAAEVRRSLGVTPEQKLILYAGKLQQRKNPHHLLEALKTVSHDAAVPPVLVFAGDGEMRGVLEFEASASTSIKFVGFKNQTEMPAYYAAADVFVLPAEREPWGLAINEAMASGTAVVASDQCGAAYDLITSETGRMVEAGNMVALAGAISEILARSNEMGAAAQAHVKPWDFEADVRGILSALEATV
jgi:glycosyltransferase involved in cell wall biosynthesis